MLPLFRAVVKFLIDIFLIKKNVHFVGKRALIFFRSTRKLKKYERFKESKQES